MTTSQNGWAVLDFGDMDRSAIAGVTFPNGFRTGDVAYVMHWFFTQFHRRVEPLETPGCWGYDKRTIDDTGVWSNHASGTAGDVNAPQHPRGKRGTFTTAQVAEIRDLLAYCDGVIRWGGDFSTTVDDMHFEIAAGSGRVADLAAKIRKDTTMADLPTDTVKALATLDGVFRAPSWRSDQSNVHWPYESVFTYVYEDTHARLDQLQRKVDDLTDMVGVLLLRLEAPTT